MNAGAALAELIDQLNIDMVEGIGRACTEDVVWEIPRTLGGRRHRWEGREAAQHFMGRVVGLFQHASYHAEIVSVIEQGDTAAAQVRVTAMSIGGEAYENDYVFWVTTRDGLVSSVKEYADTLVVSRVLLGAST